MKASLKVPTILALSGLVLCAGGLLTFANEAPSPVKSYENYKNYGLPDEHYYQIGEEPKFLTEYPEEFYPYVEELERINSELGTDYTFGIEVSEFEDIINFYTSMTIEEFRDFIYSAYENDIAHPIPFDGYITTETADPPNNILEERIVIAESGGYWYRQNDLGAYGSTGVLHNEKSTNEASDPRLGVCRGNVQLYPCD